MEDSATLERTLAIIKPDGMEFREAILSRIKDAGFFTLQSRTIQLTPEQSSEFYKNRTDDPTYALQVVSLTEGPIQVMCLTKPNALEDLKLMVGPERYDVAKTRAPNSLRALFADDLDQLKNAIHVSKTSSEAEHEIRFFFPNMILEPIHVEENVNCYLQGSVNVTLMDGLFELAKERPTEPILWLANYLMEHNPFKPVVSAPTRESAKKIQELEKQLSESP